MWEKRVIIAMALLVLLGGIFTVIYGLLGGPIG